MVWSRSTQSVTGFTAQWAASVAATWSSWVVAEVALSSVAEAAGFDPARESYHPFAHRYGSVEVSDRIFLLRQSHRPLSRCFCRACSRRHAAASSLRFRRVSFGPASVELGNNAERAPLSAATVTKMAVIAQAIYQVVRLAMQEAFQYGGSWWGPPPSVQQFLSSNGQQTV